MKTPFQLGRFPFNQNFRKFGHSGKWYRIFQEKVVRISVNCKISAMRTIQPKILEIPGAKLFDTVFIAPQEHFCMDKGSK